MLDRPRFALAILVLLFVVSALAPRLREGTLRALVRTNHNIARGCLSARGDSLVSVQPDGQTHTEEHTMTTTHSFYKAAGRRRSGRAAVPFLALALLFASGCDGFGSASDSDYLERAEQHIQAENYRAAIIEYRNALRLEDRPGTRAALGRAYLEDRQYESAINHLERAYRQTAADDLVLALARGLFQLERLSEISELPQPEGLSDHEAAELSSYRALAHLRAGETETARALLDQARDQAPGLALHSLVEARLAFRQGDAEGAARAAREAIDADAELAPAWALLGDLARWRGEGEAALEAYDRALDLRPARIAERLNRGLVLLGLERHEGAAVNARFLRQRAPGHPGGHFLQGLVHFQQGKLEAAQPYFEEALSVHRNYRPAMPYLAAIHLENESYSQAQHQLERHAALGEGTTMSYRLWARLHMEQGNPGAARARLEGALERHPEMTPMLGDMLAALYLNAEQSDAGINFLRASLDQGLESPMTRGLLVRALVEHGDVEGARDLLNQDPASARAVRALERLRQGEYAEALHLAREIIADAPGQAQGYNIKGTALRALGRFTEAQLAFQKGLEAVPNSVSLAMSLGELEMRLGNRATAREVFENLQREVPGDPASAMQLAAMAVADNDHATALKWLEAAHAHHPDHLSVALGLADLEARVGNEARADRLLTNSIERHPEALEPRLIYARRLLSLGEPQQALAVMEPVSGTHANHRTLLLNQAQALESLGEPIQARRAWATLVQQQPDNPRLRIALATNQVRTGDFAGARENLRHAIQLEPDTLEPRVLMMRTYLIEGDYEAAESEYERIAQDFPPSLELISQGASLAMAKGDLETGIQRLVRVHDMEPAEEGAVSLARAHQQAGQYAEARAVMEDWYQRSGGELTGGSKHILALVRMETGAEEEASAVYEDLLEGDPGDLVALNNLAWMLRETDPRRAVTLAERALEQAPSSLDVQHTLAVALGNTGASGRAIELLEKAVERDPRPEFRLDLAELYVEANRHDDARRILRELVRMGDFGGAARARELLDDLS